MTDVVYKIVEHDGGWAYKLGDVFSETFASRAAAQAAASMVAAEQRVPGDDETISWQDQTGAWHDEVESGSNRPNAFVAGAGDISDAGSTRSAPVRTRHRQIPSGEARSAFGSGERNTQDDLAVTRAQIRAHPLASVLLAGACGYALAVFLHGRR